MLLINFFKLPFFNLLIFATRSISRHLASSETLLHAIIDLFSKTRTLQNCEFSHDFCPRLASVTRSIYIRIYIITASCPSESGSCKSASAFRLCNYREAKLIRRRRSRFMSRRRQNSNPYASFSHSRVAQTTRKCQKQCVQDAIFRFLSYNVNSKNTLESKRATVYSQVLTNISVLMIYIYIYIYIYFSVTQS